MYLGVFTCLIYRIILDYDVFLNRNKNSRFLKLAIVVERLFFLLDSSNDQLKQKLLHSHFSRLLEFSDLFIEIYTCLPDKYRFTLFRVILIQFNHKPTQNLRVLNAANNLFSLFRSLVFEACCEGKISNSDVLELFIHKLTFFSEFDV